MRYSEHDGYLTVVWAQYNKLIHVYSWAVWSTQVRMSTSCVLDSPGVMGPYWRQPILYPVEVNKVAWSVIEVHEPEWREVWMEVVCTDQNRVRERWACAPNEKGGYRLPAF